MKVSPVTDSKRNRFLPAHFGAAMMEVESRVYTYARRAILDPESGEPCYTGGFWNFAEVENGAGFLWPAAAPQLCDLGPVGEFGGHVRGLSRAAAGLALTCCAVNHELWRRYEREGESATTIRLDQQWRLLMAAVECLPEEEQGKVIRWLD